MPSTPSTDDESTASQTVATVPVLSEALSIERRVVDTGGVRLRKQVREEPVKLQEPLKRESVSVRRVPIGKPVSSAPPVRHEGDTTIFPVLEERLVTQRQLFLVEEVHLRKSTQIESSPQTVVLRHESMLVERQDAHGEPWRAAEPGDGSEPPPGPVPEAPPSGK